MLALGKSFAARVAAKLARGNRYGVSVPAGSGCGGGNLAHGCILLELQNISLVRPHPVAVEDGCGSVWEMGMAMA